MVSNAEAKCSKIIFISKIDKKECIMPAALHAKVSIKDFVLKLFVEMMLSYHTKF